MIPEHIRPHQTIARPAYGGAIDGRVRTGDGRIVVDAVKAAERGAVL